MLPMPDGISPRNATMRLMPISLYVFSMVRMFSRVEPTQDKCGAAL